MTLNQNRHDTQIAIIGGGISGLWLLNLLRNQGYQALLFEKDALGGQQTFASQGMIHGGLKYALGGFTTTASETIKDMPNVWRNCIEGKGHIDLSGLEILSEDYYLFSDAALSSKVTAFFASKSLKARIDTLDRKDFPSAFASTSFKGCLYRLQDIVLNTPALIEKLRNKYSRYIYQCAPIVQNHKGRITGLHLNENETLRADRYIFTAGSGNAQLIQNTQLSQTSMQLRPLQQVMVKGNLPPIFAHAVSLKAGSKPRMTFTSHPHPDGQTVWYLGGNLAEEGVGKDPIDLIEDTKKELATLLPWIDLTGTSWATLNVDRAEPSQSTHARPDFPFVEAKDNAMVCWPTKLTLCPMLGDQVLEKLNTAQFTSHEETLPQLPLAQIAKTPWELAFD